MEMNGEGRRGPPLQTAPTEPDNRDRDGQDNALIYAQVAVTLGWSDTDFNSDFLAYGQTIRRFVETRFLFLSTF